MSRFTQFAPGRIRRCGHDSLLRIRKEAPPGLPAGPFVKLPELFGHCHAASAGAAGAAITAARVTGRDRCRARQRHHCCNQE